MMKVKITANDVSTLSTDPVKLLTDAGFQVDEKPYKSMTNHDEFVEFIKDADAIIIGTEKLSKETLMKMPNLKFISRRGVGYDNIDLDYCIKNNIIIGRTLGTVESSVSELTMGLILTLNRHILEHSKDLHKGIWNKRLSTGLRGATLGLVGFGNIARNVAKKALAFDMKVVYYCPHRKRDLEELYNVSYVSFEELLKVSDIISLHLPGKEDTNNMFNYNTFKSMKKSPIFINTSRGSIVSEADLSKALDEGFVSCCALDVLSEEPCTYSPLFNKDNVILSPHAGTFTTSTFYEMNMLTANMIIDFFKGALDKKYKV